MCELPRTRTVCGWPVNKSLRCAAFGTATYNWSGAAWWSFRVHLPRVLQVTFYVTARVVLQKFADTSLQHPCQRA